MIDEGGRVRGLGIGKPSLETKTERKRGIRGMAL
jgi:hypothetical protein